MDMEELRQFFAAIQPAAGYRCLASPKESGGWRHWFTDSIDGLLELYKVAPKQTLFHSVNSFREKRRLKEHAMLFKCTYLEIDFDVPGIRPKENAYKDINQLLEAFEPIEREIGQGTALIVDSGGGAHVYFPYHEPVEGNLWWSDTNYILSLCKQYGLKGIDAGPSRDKSRVLRTPGTVNEKYGRIVKIIRTNLSFRTPVFISRTSIGFDERDQELQDRRYSHINVETLRATCSHFKKFFERPETISYNEWLGCLTALRRIPNGDQIALELSRKDPRYQDDEYIINKLDSLTGKDAQSCETFLELDPAKSACLSCPFKGKGLNPLKAVLQSIKPSLPIVEPEDMPLPPEYTIEGSRVYARGKKVNSPDYGAIVTSNPYYVKGLYLDPASEAQVILFGYQKALSKDWDEISVPQNKALVNGGALELAKKINLNPRECHAYVSSSLHLYEQTCRQRGESMMLPVAKYAGWIWVKDQGYKFLYGKRIIDQNGFYRETASIDTDTRLLEILKSLAPVTNDPQKEEQLFREWQSLAFSYLDDSTVPNACKIMFLLGFVAPVIRLCPEGYRIGGAVVSVWSKTSTGKTTALRAAASIWGKPGSGDDYGLIPAINISEAAAYHNFGLYPHLPCYVDEFTNSKFYATPESVHDFIKAFADGNSPARQNQDGSQRESRKWNSLALLTANERLATRVRTMVRENDSEAAEMRIIEMNAPGPVPFSTKYDAFSRLYGLAGPRWIRHLCSRDVQERLHKWCDENLEDQLPPKARFIRKVIALAEWTRRELWEWDKNRTYISDACAQIVHFEPSLIEWFRESQMESIRESERVRALSAMEVCVLQFLHEEADTLIAYDGAPCGNRAHMDAATVRKHFIPRDGAGNFVYQRGTVSHIWVEDEGMYYIPHEALKAMHERRVKTRSFTMDMEKLAKAHGLKKRKLHLGGDVQLGRPAHSCYGFPHQLIEVWRSLDSGTDED